MKNLFIKFKSENKGFISFEDFHKQMYPIKYKEINH